MILDEDIFGFLLARVEETKKTHEEAKKNFWAVAGKPRELPRLPTGLPMPDGSEQIRKAVSEENFALKTHIDAMMKLNRYLLDGTVPDDMPAKYRKTKHSGQS